MHPISLVMFLCLVSLAAQVLVADEVPMTAPEMSYQDLLWLRADGLNGLLRL
jgi:hypothetical protein